MKYLIFILFLFFTSFVHAVTGEDDRFYTENTPWEEVFNGVLKVGGCTAFVTQSDVVVTAAHCFPNLLNKDGSFDEKKVKSTRVSFGNANFDKKDPSKKTHFDKRQAFYNPSGTPHDIDLKITDFYIKAGFGDLGISNAQATTDYALLKLNHIPKGINKFELFDPKMYKDYDLVRASNGRHVNTVGYSGDNSKTTNQKQAHLGCKAKEVFKSTHDTYINNYDCDGNPGISGGPVFYILKHKKTKKIKLAYIGTNSYGSSYGSGLDDGKRQFDPATGKYIKGIGRKTEYSGSVNLSYHKDFKEDLSEFTKDPSQFRDKKIQQSTREHTRWVLENVINKKTNAELKTYLSEERLEKNPALQSSMFHLINLGTLPKDKEKIILEANEKYVKKKKDSKETEALFNREGSKKQLKKQKIETIFKKLQDNPNHESDIDNKHRALKEYKKMFKPCKNKESKECKKFQQSQNELSEKVCKTPEKLKNTCQKVGFEDCFKKIHTCISLNRKIQENTMADIDFIFKGKDVSGLNSESFKKALKQCQLFNEKNFNKYLNEKKSYEDEIDQLRKKKEIAAQEVFDLKSELDFARKAFWDKDFEMIKLFSNSFRQQQDEVKARKIGEKIRNLYSLEKDLIFHERDKNLLGAGFFKTPDKGLKSRFCQTKANNKLLKSIRQSPPKTKDLFKKNQRRWSPEIIDYHIKRFNFLCLSKEKRHLTFGGAASDQKDAIGEFEKKEKQIKEKIRNLKREIKKESFSDENLKKEFNRYESKLKELKEINPKYSEKEKEFKIKEMELNNLQDKIHATKISKQALKMTLLPDLKKIKAPTDFFLDRYTTDQSTDPVKVKLKNFVKKYKCDPELPDPKNWKWNQVDFPQKDMNYEQIIRPSGINKKGIR